MREESGSLPKSERHKLKTLYTQGGAAYRCVRNLLKASTLSVSKVRQFLHSKRSYTKFALATRNVRQMKAFAWLKSEVCCMDLAYVDKIAKDIEGVKYLLVRRDLFDRTLDAKRLKTKDSMETVPALLTKITKKNCPKKIWVDNGTEFAEEFKKICKAEWMQIYTTVSETKAAFAERTIWSPKNILYRYMEDNGYKYIQKMTQFVKTLNSRRHCSTGSIPKNVKNSDFLFVLYSKPLREFEKLMLKIGDRIRISKQDFPFRNGYKP